MKSLLNLIKSKDTATGAPQGGNGHAAKSTGPSMRPGRTRPSGLALPPVITGPAGSEDDIVFHLRDFIARVPSDLLTKGPHDPGLELRFKGGDVIESMERGRGTVKLARIARLCPGIFRDVDTVPEDVEILFPWQKLLKQTINLHQLRVQVPDRKPAPASEPAPAPPVAAVPPASLPSPVQPEASAPPPEPVQPAVLKIAEPTSSEQPVAESPRSENSEFRDLKLVAVPGQSDPGADETAELRRALAKTKDERNELYAQLAEAKTGLATGETADPGAIERLRVERDKAQAELRASQQEQGAQIAALLAERDTAARELSAAKLLLEEAEKARPVPVDLAAEQTREKELQQLVAAREEAEKSLAGTVKKLAAARAENEALTQQLAEAGKAAASRPDPAEVDSLRRERDEAKAAAEKSLAEAVAKLDASKAESEALTRRVAEIGKAAASCPDPAEINKLRRERDEAKAAAERSLVEAVAKLDASRAESEALTRRLAEAGKAAAGRPDPTEVDSLRRERDAAQGASEKAFGELSAVKAKVKALEQRLEEASRQASDRPDDAEIENLRRERDEARTDAETARLEKRKQFDVFRTEFQSIVRQRAGALADAREAHIRLAEVSANHDESAQATATTQTAIASQQERIEKLTRERDALDRARGEAKATADKAANHRVSCERDTLTGERDAARQQLAVESKAHEAELTHLRGQLAEAAAEKTAAINQAVAKLKADLAGLTKRHEAGTQEIGRLKSSLGKAETTGKTMAAEIAEYQKAGINEMKRELELQRRKIEQLTRDLAAAIRERDSLMALPQIRPVHIAPPTLHATAA